MPTHDKEIERIKSIILATTDVLQLYLFGSYARGTQTADSDYDFFVVIPNAAERPIDVMRKIYGNLAKSAMPVSVDILASYEKDFASRKLSASLEKTVSTEGVLLYER